MEVEGPKGAEEPPEPLEAEEPQVLEELLVPQEVEGLLELLGLEEEPQELVELVQKNVLVLLEQLVAVLELCT